MAKKFCPLCDDLWAAESPTRWADLHQALFSSGSGGGFFARLFGKNPVPLQPAEIGYLHIVVEDGDQVGELFRTR
jgi:hypothetical protein